MARMQVMDIYARVSQTGKRGGSDNFWSPVEQVEKGTALCAAKGWQVGEIEQDLDSSGATMERPKFQRLVERVEAGASGGILVARMDRLGRTNLGIWQTVERIRLAGGAVVSVQESLDTTDDSPMGNAMLGFLAISAQWYLDNIKVGWRAVHERNVSMGVPTVVAWGYERVSGKGSTIRPTRQGRRYVPAVFRRAATGQTPQDIARWLNSKRVKSPTGGQWSARGVQVILANRAYRGECRYGDLVNREAWEHLVSEAEFLAVRFTRGIKVSNSPRGLLTGLIRCASCRYALDAHSKGVYRCSCKRCPAPVSAQTTAVDEWVVEHLRRAVAAESFGLQASGASGDLDAALARLEEVRTNRQMFTQDRDLIRLLGMEEYKRQLGVYVSDEEAAEEAVASAQQVTALPVFDGFSDLGLLERREIIASSVGAVFVRGRPGTGSKQGVDGRLLVLSHDDAPGPEELPMRGYARYTIRPWVYPDN